MQVGPAWRRIWALDVFVERFWGFQVVRSVDLRKEVRNDLRF